MPAAEQFIQELGMQTIGVLNRTGANEAARTSGMAQLLEKVVDFKAVARIVLGRSWQQASDTQRRDYVSLFRTYMLTTLAQRLGSYTGSEQFVVLGSRPAGDDIMVTTRILYTDYPPLVIVWRVRSTQQSMTIVDVVVEQISLVVTNRSEFDSIVRQRGIDGLLHEMRARVNGP
jgi:phospholipid transport system substrate-binding protein